MRVSGHGVAIDVPSGWEARIFRRAGAAPILHAATFALWETDGDFGAAATGRMDAGDCFIALVEYRDRGRIRPGVGLFASSGCPDPPRAGAFHPAQLQVTRRGQQGWQRFFSEQDRTCCLYAVIHPGRESAERLAVRVGEVVATLELDPLTERGDPARRSDA